MKLEKVSQVCLLFPLIVESFIMLRIHTFLIWYNVKTKSRGLTLYYFSTFFIILKMRMAVQGLCPRTTLVNWCLISPPRCLLRLRNCLWYVWFSCWLILSCEIVRYHCYCIQISSISCTLLYFTFLDFFFSYSLSSSLHLLGVSSFYRWRCCHCSSFCHALLPRRCA